MHWPSYPTAIATQIPDTATPLYALMGPPDCFIVGGLLPRPGSGGDGDGEEGRGEDRGADNGSCAGLALCGANGNETHWRLPAHRKVLQGGQTWAQGGHGMHGGEV